MGKNNFDLIRLFAASQVFFIHAFAHLNIVDTLHNPIARVASFLPGVPIFFFISGFLISASFSRSSNQRRFFLNRVLRIYPALWVCFALAVVSVWVTGFFDNTAVPAGSALAWVAAQLSIAQFFSPAFMDGYGVGNLNGSLWTISVELQFYLLIPLVFLIWKKSKAALISLFFVLVAVNLIYSLYLLPHHSDLIEVKLFAVTFLPWIAPFILGFFAQTYWKQIAPFCEGKALHWFGVYTILIVVGLFLEDVTGMQLSGNRITPLHYVPLAFLILAAAFTKPTVSHKLLRGNDVSYGIYIYHMPVLNFLLWYRIDGSLIAIFLSSIAVVALACASWWIIERPALRLKTVTLARR